MGCSLASSKAKSSMDTIDASPVQVVNGPRENLLGFAQALRSMADMVESAVNGPYRREARRELRWYTNHLNGEIQLTYKLPSWDVIDQDKE